jgi:uncharacterized protein (DUF4415 family)
MSKQTVKSVVDPANPPPLTAALKAELAALKAMPDAEIDTSDIPPLTNAFWKNAVRNPFYKPTKTSTTLCIDSDVMNHGVARGGCRARCSGLAVVAIDGIYTNGSAKRI